MFAVKIVRKKKQQSNCIGKVGTSYDLPAIWIKEGNLTVSYSTGSDISFSAYTNTEYTKIKDEINS